MFHRPSWLLAAALTCAVPTLHAAPVPGQGTWQSTLHARDIDGNGSTDAFYDSALDITWMADWDSTQRVFADAVAWVNTLSVAGLGGWRLPHMVDTGAPGCDLAYDGTDCGDNVDTAGSELAHLYHVTLGNLSYHGTDADEYDDPPQPGWGLTNTALFSGLMPSMYWTGTDNALAPGGSAWAFNMAGGTQIPTSKGLYDGYPYVRATAVRDGDVFNTVPEPASWTVAALGLLMVALARRGRPGRGPDDGSRAQ